MTKGQRLLLKEIFIYLQVLCYLILSGQSVEASDSDAANIAFVKFGKKKKRKNFFKKRKKKKTHVLCQTFTGSSQLTITI